MSSKKVPLGGKPGKPTAKAADVDAWVQDAPKESIVEEPLKEEPKEPQKRLTIDISVSLHTKLKADCAMRGRKMADEIRDLLIEKYGKS
ncbi:hypothetical protein [Halomonas sp. AOP43-F2-13]|uniref:hypothetical protein n=1 Tax=Halomonas sp. AOP43-F2-13 TaxID=3457657 RepID=UPI004034A851